MKMENTGANTNLEEENPIGIISGESSDISDKSSSVENRVYPKDCPNEYFAGY